MNTPPDKYRSVSKAVIAQGFFAVVICAILFRVKQANFLLFHSLVEGVIICIATIIFLLTWNARRFLQNDYLLAIGLTFPGIAVLELLHAFAFKGMFIFPHASADTATQLWIAARYLEAASLAGAVFFIRRRLNVAPFLAVMVTVTALLLASIFYWDNFPVCFVEGQGLTPFKIVSEHLICILYFIAMGGMVLNRQYFDRTVGRFLVISLMLNIGAELAFTFYVKVYGLSNLIGHYLKIGAYFFMYKAVFESGMIRPFDTIFRGLKDREEELREARGNLEVMVQERTKQLQLSNERLHREILKKQAKTEELRESEEKYATLVRNAMVGIFIVQNGLIIYASRRFAEIFEYPQEELVGFDPDVLFRGKFEEFSRVLSAPEDDNGGTHNEQLVRATTKNNRLIWVEIMMGPITFHGSQAVLGNVMDVTRRRELEKMVRMKDKMSSLGRVAAGMAHEIRNPLSGMNLQLANLERLCSEALTDEDMERSARLFAGIKNASAKIEDVVKRVYDFSRPNTQKRSEVDVNDCLRNVLEISAVTLRRLGIEVEKILQTDLPTCHASANLLEQLFMNLVTNAFQILEISENNKKIRIESVFSDGAVIIKVADSGPGISDVVRNKIFDPFFSTRSEGMGIGLSICHRIVRDHNGDLTVEGSGTLGGAEFIVTLPPSVQADD